MRCLPAILLCLLFAAPLPAQKQKREPLTEAQVEKIAEAGIDPNARVDLYTQYLNEHAEAIKSLTNRAKVSDARSQPPQRCTPGLHRPDGRTRRQPRHVFRPQGRHPQILAEARLTPPQRWQGILRALAGEPGFTWPARKPSRAAKICPTRPSACFRSRPTTSSCTPTKPARTAPSRSEDRGPGSGIRGQDLIRRRAGFRVSRLPPSKIPIER